MSAPEPPAGSAPDENERPENSPAAKDESPAARPSPARSRGFAPLRDRVRLPASLANRPRPEWFDRLLADPVGRVVLVVAVIGVCGLSLLICINLAWLLPGGLGPSLSLGATPTPLPAATEFESSETLVSSSSVEIPLAVPQTMKFAGQSFPVAVATVAEDGAWEVPPVPAGAAYWVYGTLVNYVFGLPDNRDNLAAIDSLAKGDTLEVQMSDGRVLRFQVSQKLSVPAGQAEVFRQTEPGLTLALVGSREDTRLVIEALFVGQSGGPSGGGGGEVFELGQPAQAGDLLATVTATKLVTFGAPELPSGLAYYIIDYVVENTGPGPVEAALAVTELIDSTGAHYAPVIPVSAVTAHPPLSGRVNPNDVINASAAYLVSANFSDIGALWQFGIGQEDAVQFSLASAAPAGPAVNVTLKAAALSADRSELILTGTVVNLGQEPIQVTEVDIALLSGAGQVGRLARSEPDLPWTLEPAAFLSYEIAFARPATSSVIFRLLSWEFELTGVQ
jgi:hypothetical protein